MPSISVQNSNYEERCALMPHGDGLNELARMKNKLGRVFDDYIVANILSTGNRSVEIGFRFAGPLISNIIRECRERRYH